MSLRKKIPWQIKIVLKLFLSKLPFSYDQWSRIGLFRHGEMDSFAYAWGVLNKHVNQFETKRQGWLGLELGPGDGLLSSLLAPALGSVGLSLVDSDDHIEKDIQKYQLQIAQFLKQSYEYSLPDYSKSSTLDEILQSAGSGAYYSQGLSSLKSLDDDSFDIIFSQAVLEHVRKIEFLETMQQCYRLLKSDGIMSHVIDFKDHLGGNLNNLRFSSSLWERDWFALGGNFYTNRLRFSEIIKICEESGFEVKVVDISHFDTIPIKRKLLSKEFANLSDDDLSVSEVHLVMHSK
jgi:SAM-dependent methyltransferase